MVQLAENETKTAELLAYKEKIGNFKMVVDKLKIKTADDNEAAVQLTQRAKLEYKEIEGKRKERTDPLEKTKKLIIADFKPLTNALKLIEADLKGKMVFYAQAVEAKNRKIEEENEKKIEKYNEKIAAGKVPANVPTMKKEIETKTTGQSFRTDKKHRVIDFNKIPKDYLMIDEQKIKAAVKMGIGIPGIEVYEEKTPVIRGI